MSLAGTRACSTRLARAAPTLAGRRPALRPALDAGVVPGRGRFGPLNHCTTPLNGSPVRGSLWREDRKVGLVDACSVLPSGARSQPARTTPAPDWQCTYKGIRNSRFYTTIEH